MLPLILASASPQRRELLRRAGLRCRVHPSRVREKTRLTSSCSEFVVTNAALKCRDVARHYSRGVVIGADTVVYGRPRGLIGKPRTLTEARAILREMAARPHWVYTGLVVRDAATGRERRAYEKTKIFMQALSEEEMRTYHRHVSPLDKAGGFDIEGRGSVFIRRIEGCYTNVIGLPMARLRLLLNDFGISCL